MKILFNNRRTLLKTSIALGGLSTGLGVLAATYNLPTPLSATEVKAAFNQGLFSLTDYVKSLINTANSAKEYNALTFLNAEAALRIAKKLDDKKSKNEKLGSLAGVVLVVKDNINVKGSPTTGASTALKNFYPPQNSSVIQKLLDADAIVLAKTNMHELAFGITSTNPTFGFVKNPYDSSKISGGSSGGTAAAIASGIAPAGLGTDTGGSTRVPAALCGIVGMRPSVGNGGKERRYSGEGVLPISHTRDTIGVMAANVQDIALLDGFLNNEEAAEIIDLKGVRIGIPKEYFWSPLDTEVENISSMALAKLKAAGAEIVEANLNGIGDLNNKISFPIALYEGYQDITAFLADQKTNISIDQLIEKIQSPDVKGAMGAAKTFPKEVYEVAIQIFRPQLQKLYADYFKSNDVHVILYPTTPITATTIDLSFSGAVSINGVAQPGGPYAQFGTFIRNTDPSSNAGIPGLSIPAGLNAAGLPVGIEIDGPLGSDKKLISIGLAIEKVLGRLPKPAL